MLRLPRPRLGLPILVKELIERSNRRRTYALRLGYALALSIAMLVTLGQFVSEMGRGDGLGLLGQGAMLFGLLLSYQLVGIYLFLPAMVAGSITQEKERDSLVLVLLTDLRPMEILLQKYLGGIIPFLGLLLISLPILACVYALGGVTPDMIISCVYLLLLTILQVAAVGIMCSSLFNSSRDAFVFSYLCLLLLYFLPSILAFGLEVIPASMFEKLMGVFPPALAAEALFSASFGRGGMVLVPLDLIGASWPAWLSIAGALLLGRIFLVRRALAPAGGLGRAILQALGRFVAGRRAMLGPAWDEAGQARRLARPVAWREGATGILGRYPGLWRVSLTVCWCLWVWLILATRAVSPWLFMLWPLAVLLLASRTANLFATERSRQTLEVLLATPLTGPEIVCQKLAALRRLLIFLVGLFVILFVVRLLARHLHLHDYYYDRDLQDPALYLVGSLLSLVVYLPMIVWFSTYIGLIARSRLKATLGAVGGMVAWCSIPLLLLGLLHQLFGVLPRGPGPFLMLTPAPCVVLVELEDLNDLEIPEWIGLLLNYAYHAACALFWRRLALKRADRLLGRVAEDLAR